MYRRKNLEQVKTKKRWTAMCLAVVTAVSLMGCGNSTGGGKAAQKEDIPDSGDGKDAVAMGRYVESITEVDAGSIMDLVELSDGRLVLLEDGAVGRMVSADGGITWEEDMLPGWYALLEAGNFMTDMKASPDGSVALLCRNYNDRFSTEEGQEEEKAEGEAGKSEEEAEEEAGKSEEKAEGEAEKSEEQAEGTEEEKTKEETEAEQTEDEIADIVMQMPQTDMGVYLISPDGNVRWAQLSLKEEEYLMSLCFSEDGSRLFAASIKGKIYEIDRNTGDGKLLMTVDTAPDVFCVWEDYMAVKNEDEGVFLYDMNTTERIVDDVLSDFVAQNCKGNLNTMFFTYTIFPAEEESLYLVCDKGTYRHVIGGTVMEQVINGGLSSFSDPTIHVAKMICTKKAEGFLTAFSEGRISTFTYDSNISTTPSQKLIAYSLTESDILRQAIIRYQEKHPDVYVEYKVGMNEEESVTREDAIKKLNAEIMAGKGPDFLILDGLPVDSYINKGALMDISPYLAELEKEEKLLSNIKESFTKDDKICVIPAAFMISMFMTEEEKVTEVSDLSSLADMVEALRSQHPGEEVLETYSEEMLLSTLMPVSAPLWLTESGQLDTKELSDYLEQTKRIYDACMEGLPEEVLEEYHRRANNTSAIASTDEVGAYNELQGGGIQIVAGEMQLSVGALRNAYNYAFMQSVKKTEQGENYQLALLPGSVKDAFTPIGLMGINAVSQNPDLAGGLLQEALSKELQSMIYPSGFPVNEAGLSEYLESLGGMLAKEERTPGERCGGYGFAAEDGKVISLVIYVPTSQESQALYDMLASVRTPYLSDVIMEEAVLEAGKMYLHDMCSLEEALETIQKKIQIYMAE